MLKANKNKAMSKEANQTIEQMKYEIAQELGVNIGANATAKENGLVGGEITKRLIEQAKNNH